MGVGGELLIGIKVPEGKVRRGGVHREDVGSVGRSECGK